jgi:transketolase
VTAPARTAPGPREVYRRALLELAHRDERVLCLDSDTGGLESGFGAALPDRYVDVGIAEANLFGVAAGLAARGLRPVVHTMAGFASMRAAEQLKIDIVANRLPVLVVATHAGMSAAHFGSSHYACEDLAVTRALPGLTVVVPADAAEIPAALDALHSTDGPGYLRLGRSSTPELRPAPPPFVLWEAAALRPGSDVTIVACGPYPTLFALRSAQTLADDGIRARVLEMHTVAPLDSAAITAAVAETAGIVTVEEHRPTGGLGDAVAEVVGWGPGCPLVRVAIRGDAPVLVADHPTLLARAGVSPAGIEAAVRHVLRAAGPATRRSHRVLRSVTEPRSVL